MKVNKLRLKNIICTAFVLVMVIVIAESAWAAPPTASVDAPCVSSNVSKTTTFEVKWSGIDPDPADGIATYDVQYKEGSSGFWTDWQTQTTLTSAFFTGAEGRSYYFRARATDFGGNTGDWSPVRFSVVPLDNTSAQIIYSGTWTSDYNPAFSYYLDTVNFTYDISDSASLNFYGSGVFLITMNGPKMGAADIFVDSVKIRTIYSYSSTYKFRVARLIKRWLISGNHNITIVNRGDAERTKFDIDGIGILY